MTENENLFYFDWASTSPADKEILRESLEISLENWGNPSSIHKAGKEAKTVLEQARTRCAKALHVKEETLYFTSGGTEGDHIPLLSILNSPRKGEILFSSIEHPAVREMALELKKTGWTIKEIPCGKDGIIKVETVKELLTPETSLVMVMAVNNETGAIQPIKEIADAIKEAAGTKRKAKFHVDCVQALGKIPVNLSEWNVDSASFSAHKISGPRGIGLLYMKDAVEPFLKGGGQEKGMRSGTENLFGAVAFSKVIEKYALYPENKTALENDQKLKEASINFVKELSNLKGCTVIPKERLSNPENYSNYVIQASFDKIPGQVLVRALDSEGFYISTGSACSSRKNNRPILEAMKVEKKLQENAVRFSFGHSTTKEAIDALLSKLKEINNKFNP